MLSAELSAERFFAVSNANTVIEYGVMFDKPLMVVAGVVVVLLYTPFTYTLYPVTPTLSVDPSHRTTTLVPVKLLNVRFVGDVGAVLSGAAAVVTDNAVLRAERFFIASIDCTWIEYVVSGVNPVKSVFAAVTVFRYTLLTYTLYPVTPTLSVEGVHVSRIRLLNTLVAVKPPGVLGTMTSAGALVVAV